MSFSNFLFGRPGQYQQRSTLGPEQQGLYNQLQQANMGPGAGGSFGSAADYYRDLLSDNSQTAQMMQAPEMRRFNEDIIPQLSEQFAGMGSGGLSSSGFRNAAVNAGTDLSERLGAIRAGLRQQGAAGLMGLGQQGLQQYNENIYQQGQPGLIDAAAPALGAGLSMFAGPAAGAAGNAFGNWLSGSYGSGGQNGASSVGGQRIGIQNGQYNFGGTR